ncbi:hypothetical protein D3C78_1490730 [compost metagenome]
MADILEALRGWQRLPAQALPRQPASDPVDEPPLLALLRAAPQSSEALAVSSGLALPELLAQLTELELDGRIACDNGCWVWRS